MDIIVIAARIRVRLLLDGQLLALERVQILNLLRRRHRHQIRLLAHAAQIGAGQDAVRTGPGAGRRCARIRSATAAAARRHMHAGHRRAGIGGARRAAAAAVAAAGGHFIAAIYTSTERGISDITAISSLKIRVV